MVIDAMGASVGSILWNDWYNFQHFVLGWINSRNPNFTWLHKILLAYSINIAV